MRMERVFGWGLKHKESGCLKLPWIYSSKTAASIKAQENPGYVLVRVEIVETVPVCQTGCTLVDDVPVFCKRHSP